MATYIVWTEQEQRFGNWRVVPGLGTEPVFKTFTIRQKARYSSDNSPEMQERAKRYIETDMQDKPSARVVIIND